MPDTSDQLDVNRRVFITGLGHVSLGLVLSGLLGGCESLLKQIKNRPVRRRLRTGSPEVDHAITVYKEALTLMKALPAGNPRSWAAQAALHGTVGGGFNFCQHGTQHFFSWHRAYLLYFEQICQQLTGEKSFGLPYWNWNQDPAMHPEFTNAASPLSHPRNNTTVAGNWAFTDAALGPIMSDTNFFTFGSQIEGTLHNTAHVVVGQDMVTGGSPLDPVFWAHHGMVDYCWAKWNIEIENDNTNDAGWINTSWNHFVNGQGDPISVTAGLTPLMPLLSYRYESSAVGGFTTAAELSARDLKKIETRLKEGAPVRFEVKRRVPILRAARLTLDKPFSAQTQISAADLAGLIEAEEHSEQVFVSVKTAILPPVNDFFVRVFINLPGANAQTPTNDVHHAGSFAFFGTQGEGHGDHRGKTDFLVNATDTLRKLRSAGLLRTGEPLSVQLVAVPISGDFARADVELTLEDVELIVSPVVVRAK